MWLPLRLVVFSAVKGFIVDLHAESVFNQVSELGVLGSIEGLNAVTDDDGVREITTSADDTAAFRPGLIAVSHGTGDSQLHERGKHAADWLAGTAHLLARPAGARS